MTPEVEIMDLAYHVMQQARMVAEIAPGNPYRIEVAEDLVERAQILARWVRGEDW